MEVVILVAGRGTRFNGYLPKSLVKFGEETLLEKTIRSVRAVGAEIPIRVITGYEAGQISEKIGELGDKNIDCIFNEDFEVDQNIISAKIGLESSSSDTLVLEGDCVYNSETIEQFFSYLGRGESVIFANKMAKEGGKNAIISSNHDSAISGYIIGNRPDSINLEEWNDMAGAAIFSKSEIAVFLAWVRNGGFDPSETYYFRPLLDFDGMEFRTKVVKLTDGSQTLSFNTQSQLIMVKEEMGLETQIKLVKTSFLRHVEDFSEKRVKWLREKIVSEGIWNKPICIDGEFGIVMDGQHRMEVAKELGFKIVPALTFNHDDVEFWSLRKSHEVSKEKIMDNFESGDIYPYKTVKYGFPVDVPSCSFNLAELE